MTIVDVVGANSNLFDLWYNDQPVAWRSACTGASKRRSTGRMRWPRRPSAATSSPCARASRSRKRCLPRCPYP